MIECFSKRQCDWIVSKNNCSCCICWGISQPGRHISSHNGWNWSVNAVADIVIPAFLAALQASITCLLGSSSFFFFSFYLWIECIEWESDFGFLKYWIPWECNWFRKKDKNLAISSSPNGTYDRKCLRLIGCVCNLRIKLKGKKKRIWRFNY